MTSDASVLCGGTPWLVLSPDPPPCADPFWNSHGKLYGVLSWVRVGKTTWKLAGMCVTLRKRPDTYISMIHSSDGIPVACLQLVHHRLRPYLRSVLK